MKKALSLIACAAVLFTACSKDSSDPVPTPTPTPVVGDGTGKFTFSVDTALFRVDTLTISYYGRDGQLKSEVLLNQNSWTSPELLFKTGDSLQATVNAVGEVKVASASPAEIKKVEFKVNPSTVAVPQEKGSGSITEYSAKRNATRFIRTSAIKKRY